MRKIYFTVLFTFTLCSISYAEDDLGLGAYAKDIGSSADANAITFYDTWANSLINKIESGHADGIIIDGAADTDLYSSDGAGNVTVKEGANVTNVLNKTDVSNTTVLVNKNQKRY